MKIIKKFTEYNSINEEFTSSKQFDVYVIYWANMEAMSSEVGGPIVFQNLEQFQSWVDEYEIHVVEKNIEHGMYILDLYLSPKYNIGLPKNPKAPSEGEYLGELMGVDFMEI